MRGHSFTQLKQATLVAAGLVLLGSVAGCGGPPLPAPSSVPDALQGRVGRAIAFAAGSGFEENRGQLHPLVFYHARAADASIYLAAGGLTLSLDGWAWKLDFLDAARSVRPQSEGAPSAVANYLVGSPDRWRVDVPAYESIAYRGLWPGIDAAFSGTGGSLKYEFRVAPGADPARIALAYRGATSLFVDGRGRLEVGGPRRALVDAAPTAYQLTPSGLRPVAVRYALAPGSGYVYGFELGDYDSTRPLVIDPELVFGTYLGGRDSDSASALAVDASGSAYITGTTRSDTDFPVTPGAFDVEHFGVGYDAFVSKFTPDGSSLVYSTFLGGDGEDVGRAIEVDEAGSVYVTGLTEADDFPITPNAFDTTRKEQEAFVAKLTPDGSGLEYASFLGGGEWDQVLGIAVDEKGGAHLTGYTNSDNFPVTAGAFDTTYNGPGQLSDAFVAKVSPDGSDLTYSTYLGGSQIGGESGHAIDIDPQGNAYVVGGTWAPNFPTTPGAFDTTHGGGGESPIDGFVSKLNPTGTNLVYSSFLGGGRSDVAVGVRVDGRGRAYVVGGTDSRDFPVSPDAFDRMQAADEGFVTKFNASGSGLVYSSFLGGEANDSINAIVLDGNLSAHVTGSTSSPDFPVTDDAYDPTFNGECDVFVTTIRRNGKTIRNSTYLGGPECESARGIALDGTGASYVAGISFGGGFPTTPDAFDPSTNGEEDAFLAKLGT